MELLQDSIYKIEKVELLQIIMEKKNNLWRLCQICCSFPKVDDKNVYEITYSFANGYELENYRLVVEKDELVPSISRVYNSAVYYENEMKELWGLNIENIKLDLHNTLYRIDETTPFIPKEGQ